MNERDARGVGEKRRVSCISAGFVGCQAHELIAVVSLRRVILFSCSKHCCNISHSYFQPSCAKRRIGRSRALEPAFRSLRNLSTTSTSHTSKRLYKSLQKRSPHPRLIPRWSPNTINPLIPPLPNILMTPRNPSPSSIPKNFFMQIPFLNHTNLLCSTFYPLQDFRMKLRGE